MSAGIWPMDLPQKPLRSGYSEKMPNELNRSDMDSGPAKVRPKGKSKPTTIEATYVLTNEQVTLLKTFLLDTLSYGAVCFDWPHPTLERYVRSRIVPQSDCLCEITPFGNSLHWQVTLTLEVFIDVPLT